jgi:sterol desaturase/sphingolipid hydroxylase (fatty acid hydroxylase superfamily)
LSEKDILQVTLKEFNNFILNPENAFYWGYFAFYLLTLIFLFHYKVYKKEEGLSWRSFLSFCFPAHIYGHPSFKEDIFFSLFQVVSIVFVKFIKLFTEVGIITFFIMLVESNLLALYKGGSPFFEQISRQNIFYFLLLFLVFDFGNFIGHYLLHKIPFLWEFHKVHHSAVKLNPLTQVRNHPMDDALRVITRGISVGIFIGSYQFLFGNVPVNWLGTIIAIELIYLLTFHLRHSHIWFSFGPFLSYLFISPAQHQIHHSCEIRHRDKNLGVALSIWDFFFGCLYVPKEKEQFTIGLSNAREQEELKGFWNLLIIPFKNSIIILFKLIFKRTKEK